MEGRRQVDQGRRVGRDDDGEDGRGIGLGPDVSKPDAQGRLRGVMARHLS